MYKDSRTDNWGGYHDNNRDPRNYHYARSTHELGWGFYRSDIQPTEYHELRFSISTILFTISILLLLAAVFLDFRNSIYIIAHLIEDWWNTFDIFIN